MTTKKTHVARSRVLGPILAALAMIALMLLPSMAGATENAPPAFRPSPPQPEDVALRAYDDFATAMADNELTDGDVNRLNLGLMEQQGLVDRGWYQTVADYELQLQDRAPPPKQILRKIHKVCDIDGDQVEDILINSFDIPTSRPTVQAVSGDLGYILWTRQGTTYIPPGFPLPGYNPGNNPLPPRPQTNPNGPGGLPSPQSPQNMYPTVDINDDGVCDFMFMSQSISAVGIDPLIWLITTTFMVANGSNGYSTSAPFWQQTYQSQAIRTGATLTFGLVVCYDLVNHPTGFLHWVSANGPRWARKTTVAHYCQTICVFDWRGEDTIHLHDAISSRPFWSRTINMSREQDPTAKQKEQWTNITHLIGAAPLGGDEEFEILLLQPRFKTPNADARCPLNNPVDGSPLYRTGRGLTALALKGEVNGKGDDFWKTLILEQGSDRVNLAFEESFEILMWAWLQVIGDINGDGTAEVVVLYLGQEASIYAPTTPNGQFRTHVVPLSGKNGLRLWGNADPRFQGWGFVADMNPNYQTSVPLLALGTVDLPTPVPPGGRLPLKGVRLSVLDATDGTSKWSYEERFAQDSYISYDMTLNQYLSALAPYDWTGDGVKDLVTPSRFFEATGANQTLLATTEHSYQILDGVEGTLHKEIRAWGPSGIVTSCGKGENGEGEPHLTVFSGHSKRYDISRFNITPEVTQHWRFALFNNPDMQGATLGTDIYFVGTQCITTRSNSTYFALNLGLFSMKRGQEIMGPYGDIGVEDDDLLERAQILWVEPPVRGKPPMSVEEILKYFEVPETHPGLMLAFTAGPAVPGLIAGLGLGRLRLRKGGSP